MTTVAVVVGILAVAGLILTERIVSRVRAVYSQLLLMDVTLRWIHELLQEKLSGIASDIEDIKDELLSNSNGDGLDGDDALDDDET